ncbi:hypothetical protein RFI_01883 [Reticulomyxa filosa]|uniref:Uncharacterized protein n=1 Tax=Reticulomyxa filosa TaxID=46433 RepID=X6P9H1_RETFI|nr:hypothetical protein RFI_01883 [Reticulomyxa filosa]|eukprot:ETO35190.1 hypothetical protein RFI_01883 [Reticulomyxa filosa]
MYAFFLYACLLSILFCSPQFPRIHFYHIDATKGKKINKEQLKMQLRFINCFGKQKTYCGYYSFDKEATVGHFGECLQCKQMVRQSWPLLQMKVQSGDVTSNVDRNEAKINPFFPNHNQSSFDTSNFTKYTCDYSQNTTFAVTSKSQNRCLKETFFQNEEL